MAELVFDADSVKPEPPEPEESAQKIALMIGRNRTEYKWDVRREYDWPGLCALFATAPPGGKDGSCYTPATFKGAQRNMNEAAKISVAVLDSDCGHPLAEIERNVRAVGWRAIIHSTWSHLTDTTMLAADPCDKWMAANQGKTLGDYMGRAKGYLPGIVESATVASEEIDDTTRAYVVKHAPCPKFRIILPLESAWVAGDYDSQALANAVWKERIRALTAALDLFADQSCTDTSRLFYMPRVRPGGQYLVRVIEGTACPIWTLREAKSETPAPVHPSLHPPLALVQPHRAFKADGLAGESIDLTTWAATYARRFEIVTALQARAPGVFGSRRTGVKWHLECPCAADHVTGAMDRTGTFAVNASQIGAAGMPGLDSGFILHCSHAGCAGKDRLDHVRALLTAGKLSVADLTAPEFLTGGPPMVDTAGLIAAGRLTTASDATGAGGIEPRLYANLPGALGALHEWMITSGTKEQPVLALGAALAFMAAAIGQRVMLQRWNTRPNIYIVGIGHSGCGKQQALNCCKRIARMAGLSAKVTGVEEIISDAGIMTAVAAAPHHVMLIDEISSLISSAGDKNAQTSLKATVTTLLKLYSSSETSIKTKAYADPEKNKEIDQPCVSLYGCSTRKGLFKSLSATDISSGLLSRVVLFDAGDHDPLGHAPGAVQPPESVVDWLRAWDKVDPVPNKTHRIGGEAVIEPREVMLTAEAAAIADAFGVEMHYAKIAAREKETDALYARAQENALKFALIRSCAILPHRTENGPVIDESALCVDAEIMRWAVDMSRATVARMEMAAGEIVDSVYEGKLKALRDAIRAAGAGGMDRTQMAKCRAAKVPQRELEDLLSGLCASKDICYIGNINIGKRGKPRAVYLHRAFMSTELLALHDGDETNDV